MNSPTLVASSVSFWRDENPVPVTSGGYNPLVSGLFENLRGGRTSVKRDVSESFGGAGLGQLHRRRGEALDGAEGAAHLVRLVGVRLVIEDDDLAGGVLIVLIV